MGIFGWSLPPGCTHRHIEEAFGGDRPCEVCGEFEDGCICPECPDCSAIGDPRCYPAHGLVRTHEQVMRLLWNEAIWEDEARADALAIEDRIIEEM